MIRRARVACGVLGALLALLSGCGVSAERSPRALATEDAPLQLRPAPVDTASVGRGTRQLFFVAGDRLVPVRRKSDDSSARAVLDTLLAGPTAEERAQGLTTALPTIGGIDEVSVERGVAVVRLGPALLETGRTDQVQAFGQIVLTLVADPQIDAVRFEQGGESLLVPRGDGALDGGSLSAVDYRELVD